MVISHEQMMIEKFQPYQNLPKSDTKRIPLGGQHHLLISLSNELYCAENPFQKQISIKKILVKSPYMKINDDSKFLMSIFVFTIIKYI